MKKYFKPSTIVIILTSIQVFMILFLIFNFFLAILYLPKIISIVLILLLGYFLIKMPISVIVDANSITVNQLIGKVTFDRNSCIVRRLNDKEMKRTFRVFGTGGMGGY